MKHPKRPGLYVVKNYLDEKALVYYNPHRKTLTLLHSQMSGWIKHPREEKLYDSELACLKFKRPKKN